MDANIIGAGAAVISAMSWAVGAVLFKKLGETLSSFTMTLAKGAISVVLLALLSLFVRGNEEIGYRTYMILACSGLLGIAISDTLFFAALQDLGSQALVLLSSLGQVITVLLAVLVLGEAPSLRGWAGIVLITLGVGVGIYPRLSLDKQSASLRGVLLGLASVLCMSVSVILTKMGVESVSAIQATFIRMLAGTLGMLMVGIFTGRIEASIQPFKDLRVVRLFFVSVCIVTFGGFWLSVAALKYTSVSVANSLISTEPLFVIPVAAIFLKEKVTYKSVIGAIITIIGIVLLCSSNPAGQIS